MKINIKNKVASCNDISTNVKRYLWNKSKQKPPTFMPFGVEKIAITPKKAGLVDYKESLMAAIIENNHTQGRYFITARKTDKTPRTSNTTRKITPTIKESPHKDETLLHSFYARSFLG
jgi:hypothetical protein